MLTLYVHTLSSSSRALVWILCEYKLSFKIADVSIPEFKDQILRLNPFGNIPFLVDDEYQLSEFESIIKYIQITYKKRIPRIIDTPLGSAYIQEINQWISGSLEPAVQNYLSINLWHKLMHPEQTSFKSDRMRESVEIKLNKSLEVLEERLADRQYLAVKESVADFLGYSTVSMLDLVSFKFEKFENLRKWMSTVSSIPSTRVLPLDDVCTHVQSLLAACQTSRF